MKEEREREREEGGREGGRETDMVGTITCDSRVSAIEPRGTNLDFKRCVLGRIDGGGGEGRTSETLENATALEPGVTAEVNGSRGR